VRESLPDLLRELGFAAQAFSSAEEFLASDCVNQAECLILDILMPGMSGPELQRELRLRRQEIPTIFITGNKDEKADSGMLEQGAVESLIKPFSDTALLKALQAALRAKRCNTSAVNRGRRPGGRGISLRAQESFSFERVYRGLWTVVAV
jgi:FixJ family two-component response regulator